MKQRLSSLSMDTVRTQSANVFNTLQGFKPYQEAQTISVYLSMPAAEIQTDAIVRHALSQGKQVFIPYLHKSPLQIPDTPSRVMDMVLLESIQDYESLQPDKWGIPSVDPATVNSRQRILGRPEAHSDKVSTLDLMLLPGVAFDYDASGGVRRLGHGKGFYDFFLNRYLAQHGLHADDDSSLQLWGLSLSEQLLAPGSGEEVPVGPQDRRLHGLLLGDGRVSESGSQV
ncbi:5-formyltetrahydrofolate cyclo-ligase [Emericellopsis atlantica]|uniref:5-formyltetrahydrofolate cyclo-ligase n=1 Tax=Emericellopsis atlantica TaxID=2614577 RepID=A0A9P7ZXR6_9HYPO|nr:5-formyltetrahydrofolate cyclo-ligase [Emericellopsis atlantica]KAG9259220.1 5-formyltetrahydrofolate cyclo-ligase [Emericellopsis atlantica]